MAKGKASGIHLTNKDVSKVIGMVARGDREHDIACYFGVNQARIAEAKDGSHGVIAAAPSHELPPKGPPGVKGRRLRASVAKAVDALTSKEESGWKEALTLLQDAGIRYDSHES